MPATAAEIVPETVCPTVPAAVPAPVPTGGPQPTPRGVPRFSVVVPAYGVAGRLSEALDSVLGQRTGGRPGTGTGDGDGPAGAADGPPGIEVIPVCSAGDTLDAAVAARHARRDPRVKPVFSPPDAGLGGARNVGLAAARGDYVLFLDGDDTLAPGTLAAVADRLARTGEVDVLLMGHERVHWWRGPLPGDPLEEHLGEVPEGAFAPQDVPRLSGGTLPAWSAVHRRAFLAAHGLTFSGGWYTDVGFVGLELLAARRVAVLRRVGVRHLLRRQGSRLREPGPHHFDLLDQVDTVLTRARERDRLPSDCRHALFGQLVAQLLRTAASAPELLPDGPCGTGAGGREFFRRAAELYRRHRPAGYRTPPERLGVQHRLLAAGAYQAFAALRGAHRQVGRTVRGARAAAVRLGAHVPGRHGAYAAALRRPVDENLAVYCAYWGRGYLCNPAAIHAAARRLAPHIRSVFLVTEQAAEKMPDGVEHAVLGTPPAWEALARAKYLVNNANFANAVVKRPGTVHLQTQHGTPLKKMGIEQAEYPVVAAHSGSFGKLLARVDRWDYNLSSNRHSTEVWEREFPADYEMLEYGYPRNDVYQSATAEDVARIRRALGVPEDRVAILYAPTHRDYRTAFRPQLDLDAFCAAAGERFVVLLRAHYFYGTAGEAAAGHPRIIDVSGHPSVEEVCLAADALVTDYSSIMFDYANLDRPIVVHADDWNVYRETRGVTFDLTEHPPGPVVTTGAALAAVFRDGTWAGAEAARLRARFRERFCTFDDGLAAERVVRRVLLGEPPEALPPVIPLAERTPAPAAHPAARATGAAPPPAAPLGTAGPAGPSGAPHPSRPGPAAHRTAPPTTPEKS